MNSATLTWSGTASTELAATESDRSIDSIAVLYDRFGALAFTLAQRIVRDPGIAEDVVQDSFVALWKNVHRYDARRGSVQSWLCRIVRNRALDRLRGTSGRQRRDQSLEAGVSLRAPTDVASEVLLHEDRRAVATAVASLPRRQREAIELAYFGGYTQTEIAAMTSAPLGTVKSRTRAGMRTLATTLGTMRA